MTSSHASLVDEAIAELELHRQDPPDRRHLGGLTIGVLAAPAF
jgi:hypothetical protein